MKTNRFALTVVAGWLIAGGLVASAVERVPPSDEAVLAWFEAEEAGQIEVKFIPKDASQAMVLVRNLTDAPVRLRLPESFAAVPIQAQMGMGGMGGMGGGGMGGMGGGMGGMGGGMGGGQGMGGGMGGMGGGMGGMGGGMGGGGMMGGMMRIPAEKQLKVKVTTVCLEHNKPDPNPRMAYKMIPADQFTQDARVIEVCRLLGYNRLSQNVAQAAAWHLTDNLSWQQLAVKNRIESKYTGNVAWFHPRELHLAAMIVADSNRLVTSETPRHEEPGYDGN